MSGLRHRKISPQRTHTLETWLKEKGLSETLVSSSLRRHGPFSVSRPSILE